MTDQKQKQECEGCLGLSDEHICQDYADFLAMKAAKDKCQNCEAKDRRIEELEAENVGLWTALEQLRMAESEAVRKHVRQALQLLETDYD